MAVVTSYLVMYEKAIKERNEARARVEELEREYLANLTKSTGYLADIAQRDERIRELERDVADAGDEANKAIARADDSYILFLKSELALARLSEAAQAVVDTRPTTSRRDEAVDALRAALEKL